MPTLFIADELAFPRVAEGTGASLQEVALIFIALCTSTQGSAVSASLQPTLLAYIVFNELVFIWVAEGAGVSIQQVVGLALTAHR